MRKLLFIFSLILFSSCSNKHGSAEAVALNILDATSASPMAKIEIAKINQSVIKQDNHKLSKTEIELLYKEGMINITEKEELLKLASN